MKKPKALSKRSVNPALEAQVRLSFSVELARGASFIASTLTPESRAVAVEETMQHFVRDRGIESFEAFREVLARGLEKRNSMIGADAVRLHKFAEVASTLEGSATGEHGSRHSGKGEVKRPNRISARIVREPRPILAVDDNPLDLELLQIALGKSLPGHPVITMRDGRQALDFLLGESDHSGRSNQEPEFVLLDIKMPRISGLEVLEVIRSKSQLRHIPVVALTSSREERDIKHAYELGVNGYVVKHIDFPDFAESISGICSMWAMRNEVPRGFRPRLS